MDVPAEELRAVFGSTEATSVTALHEPVASATAGLWRVQCGARSAVLKLLAHDAEHRGVWGSGDDPQHWYYWRREACAYASGLLDALTGGLRAPDHLLVRERDDGSIALWLEDVRGTPGTRWSVRDYAPAAERLGRAQAAITPPDHPWLARDWMRAYLGQRTRFLRALHDDALFARTDAFDAATVARARALLDDNARFLDALDTMPRALCHFDLHPANLFATGDTTTLIDWAFVGTGAVGEDAGNLVPDAVFDFHVAPDAIDDLYDTIASGYAAGARTDPRLAMCCTMAAKYVWIVPATALAVADGRELLNRRPIAETLDHWLPTIDFVLARADDARRLLSHAG